MAGKRFPIGSPVAIAGAVLVVAGVSLAWLTLTISADQGTAVFSLSGWNYTLGVAAGITGVVAALVAAVTIAPALRIGRAGGVILLLLGVGVLGVGVAQIATRPSVDAMNKQIGAAFSKAEIANYDQQLSGWTGLKTSVGYGLGLWLALGGGLIVALGGVLTASFGAARAAAGQPGWPAAQAPPGPAYPYRGPGYPASPQVPVGAPPAPYGAQLAPPPQVAGFAAPAAPAAIPSVPIAPTPLAAPAAGTAAGAASAKFCAACGASFANDTSRFCASCGAPRPGAG